MASKGVVEHSAKGNAVDDAGMQAKPNDPASVLIHDDQYPVSPQHGRLAAEQIDAPATVLQVAEESQPRRTVGVWLGVVMLGLDTPHDVLIDGDAEGPRDLLGDSRAAPGGIALLGGDNRLDELLGRALGTRLAPDLGREEPVVLAPGQDSVKVQEGRRLYHDGRADPPGGPHKQGAPTGKEAIRKAEVGSAVAGTIENQQLMFDEEGFGHYGTSAAGACQSDEGGDDMDEKDNEIAHVRMVATSSKPSQFPAD